MTNGQEEYGGIAQLQFELAKLEEKEKINEERGSLDEAIYQLEKYEKALKEKSSQPLLEKLLFDYNKKLLAEDPFYYERLRTKLTIESHENKIINKIKSIFNDKYYYQKELKKIMEELI